MRTDKIIAERYAEALANVLEKPEAYQSAQEALEAFLQVQKEHPDLLEVIEDPSLARSDKAEFILSIADALELDEIMRGFLHLLVMKERFTALQQIAEVFRHICNERMGRIEVEVRSVVALSDQQLERLKIVVHKLTGREAILRTIEDPGVLGGIRVQMNSQVLDTTVAHHLEEIRRSLARKQPGLTGA